MTIGTHCGLYPRTYDHNDHRYNQIKEELSINYISSIAGFLGAEVVRHGPILDNEGIDITIAVPLGLFDGCKNPKPRLDFQMKCTSCPSFDRSDDSIRLRVDQVTRNRMMRNDICPTLIAVLVLPEEVDRWISVKEEGLTINRYMLWCNPSYSRYREQLKDGARLIRLPLKNRMNEETLHRLFEKAANCEVITDEI